MSRQELKIQELERKMYALNQERAAILSQINKLKTEIKAGIPKSGDVVAWRGRLYLCTDEPEDPSIDNGPVIVGLETGIRYSPSPEEYAIRGSITDMFIAKQLVAEILSAQDGCGHNIMSNACTLGLSAVASIRRALADHGIKGVE
jgi:hypothetical protein